MNQLKSNGVCPQCELSGENHKVYLNRGDLWECPKWHLQLQTIAKEFLGIGMERGNGHFSTLENDSVKLGTRILLRNLSFKGDDRIIKDKNELIDYLKLCNSKIKYLEKFRNIEKWCLTLITSHY